VAVVVVVLERPAAGLDQVAAAAAAEGMLPALNLSQ
jgi:hypothetical protein